MIAKRYLQNKNHREMGKMITSILGVMQITCLAISTISMIKNMKHVAKTQKESREIK